MGTARGHTAYSERVRAQGAAIPLATAGLLTPIIAAAMAASSLFVVSHSLRLCRFHTLRPANPPVERR